MVTKIKTGSVIKIQITFKKRDSGRDTSGGVPPDRGEYLTLPSLTHAATIFNPM